jgi:hypothetical protein
MPANRQPRVGRHIEICGHQPPLRQSHPDPGTNSILRVLRQWLRAWAKNQFGKLPAKAEGGCQERRRDHLHEKETRTWIRVHSFFPDCCLASVIERLSVQKVTREWSFAGSSICCVRERTVQENLSDKGLVLPGFGTRLPVVPF